MPPRAEVFEFKSADGACLRAATFAAENPSGAVVLMSGRSEFIEKYFEVIEELQARGFSVAMMDWRGQGLSERLLPDPEKGHITNFAAYRADLQRFTEKVALEKFDGPYILMTHSMGGVPALQLLADGYDIFKGAIVCAPMTRLFTSPIKRTIVGMLAAASCRAGFERRSVPGVKEESLQFKGNVLTSDENRHDRFRELQVVSPKAIIREPTYGWLNAAHEAMENLHQPNRFAELTTPIRIISAEDDKLVASSDHAYFADNYRLIDLVTIEGAMHEIMMEQDIYRAAYWAAVDSFLERVLPA